MFQINVLRVSGCAVKLSNAHGKWIIMEQQNIYIHSKFNGTIVNDATGLERRQLTFLMKNLKMHVFTDLDLFRMTKKDIVDAIIKYHMEQLSNKT